MIFVRIQKRFPERAVEWQAAVILAAWGALLLHPTDTFAGPSYAMFRDLMPEHGWGAIMFFLGTIRLAGLIINGSMQTVTPWIRAISAAGGFLIFSGISLGFLLAVNLSTALAVYPVLAVFELISIYRSMHDAGAGNDH